MSKNNKKTRFRLASYTTSAYVPLGAVLEALGQIHVHVEQAQTQTLQLHDVTVTHIILSSWRQYILVVHFQQTQSVPPPERFTESVSYTVGQTT